VLPNVCIFTQKTSNEAASDCCSRGMTLLAIETDSEYNCMTKQLLRCKSKNYNFPMPFSPVPQCPTEYNNFCPHVATFWPEATTYHVALHDYYDEGNFKWCKNKKFSIPLIADGALKFVQKNQLANGENCGALQVLNDIQTMKMNVVACDESMEFICEVITIFVLHLFQIYPVN
jgi:hypothetical protein